MGPLVSVVPDGILYTKVRSEDVAEIVQQTLAGGQVVERLLYKDPATRKSCQGLEDNPFYARQNRLVLHECGFLDPEDIREYMLHGGYRRRGRLSSRCRRRRSARRSSNPACAAVAAADSRPDASGKRRAFRIRPRSMSSATATKATPARS